MCRPEELVDYALDLLSKPQAKDCEAGARTLCFLFVKYVAIFGWVPSLLKEEQRRKLNSTPITSSSSSGLFFLSIFFPYQRN